MQRDFRDYRKCRGLETFLCIRRAVFGNKCRGGGRGLFWFLEIFAKVCERGLHLDDTFCEAVSKSEEVIEGPQDRKLQDERRVGGRQHRVLLQTCERHFENKGGKTHLDADGVSQRDLRRIKKGRQIVEIAQGHIVTGDHGVYVHGLCTTFVNTSWSVIITEVVAIEKAIVCVKEANIQ